MKKIYLFVIVTAAMLQGCGLLGQPIAEKVAKVVIKYCEEPYTARVTYRQTINAELAPYRHVLHVHCDGDPPDASGDDSADSG